MKLAPMSILSEQLIGDIIDSCHDLFKRTIGAKDRPKLGNREIYIRFNWIEYKAEIFWHIGSVKNMPILDICPCNNDISSVICAANCVNGTDMIALSDGLVRAKCIYRATRVGWILDIVNMYNAADSRVKYWEKTNKNHRKRVYLRYQEEENDYLVVFEEKNANRVQLITGYPVFLISAKRDLDKDYLNYQKNL